MEQSPKENEAKLAVAAVALKVKPVEAENTDEPVHTITAAERPHRRRLAARLPAGSQEVS